MRFELKGQDVSILKVDPQFSICEDRALDAPAWGGKGSKGRLEPRAARPQSTVQGYLAHKK